jgi:hypothetical protein
MFTCSHLFPRTTSLAMVPDREPWQRLIFPAALARRAASRLADLQEEMLRDGGQGGNRRGDGPPAGPSGAYAAQGVGERICLPIHPNLIWLVFVAK